MFGAVDGLVTNASLISGLGGGGVTAHTVVLTGVAALVAGAFSMGTGEYISVTNGTSSFMPRSHSSGRCWPGFPPLSRRSWRGISASTAPIRTPPPGWPRPVRDPRTALRIHTREELGVDPDELPSPLLAGAASLLAFSLGALVPLLPYLAGVPVLAVTLALTAIALVVGGMAVGPLTGQPVLRSGVRQLLLGGLAIAVTFGVGYLIGGHGA